MYAVHHQKLSPESFSLLVLFIYFFKKELLCWRGPCMQWEAMTDGAI